MKPPRYLFFKLSVALGLLLGLILLLDTVVTYRYVSNVLVRQEAQREAQRKALSIGRAARLTHASDPHELEAVLDELVRESPPDRDPERFAAVRAAYDEVRDPATRVRSQLFEIATTDTLESIAKDLRMRLRRSRLPLNLLLTLADSR